MISYVTKRLFVVHEDGENYNFASEEYLRGLDIRPNTVIDISGGEWNFCVGGHTDVRKQLYQTVFGDDVAYHHYDYNDPDRTTYTDLINKIIDDLIHGKYVMIMARETEPNFGSKFVLEMLGQAFGEFRDRKYKLFVHKI